MRFSKKKTPGFEQFERSVVEPIRAFRLTLDEDKLDESALSIRQLTEQVAGPAIVSLRQFASFNGWLTRRNGFRLSARTLRKLNPGYRVSVRRYTRPELGRRASVLRHGFRVHATGASDLGAFVFRVIGPHGNLQDLTPSNGDATYIMDALTSTDTPKLGDKTVLPVGYLDSVLQAPAPDDGHPETWLAALVHRHPQEIFELIDSPRGRFAAREFAKLLRIYPANARWADRFSMSANGSDGPFSSDYSVLRAVRPNPTRDRADASMTVPLMVRDGDIVHAGRGTRPMPIPSEKWLHFEDAIVQDGGTVVVDDALIVYEEAADPRRDFVAGQQYSLHGSEYHPETALALMKPRATVPIPEGILLSGRNDANWYHWLIEYLPRVVQAEEVIDSGVPLIVSSRVPAAGIEALRTLTERAILVADPATSQRIGRLHVVAPPAQILDTTRVPWSDGLSINPAPLQAMRAIWRKQINPTAERRRVFLHRRAEHRGLLNQEDLMRVAQRHGLEVYDPSLMNFAEQLDLFASASLLVGASGAVMANYLMMTPGSRVLALTSESLQDFVLPAAIAEIANVRFDYLVGPSDLSLAEASDRNAWIHAHFTIPKGSFEAALTEALGALS
jgi:capsular polysaccharide biosynthesis protein